MTCREKLKEEYPELIDWAHEFFGEKVNYFGCPHMFKYQDRPGDCNQETGYIISCNACWAREVKE